jgi:transcriptional regulator with XRE-family HTH domain
MDLGKRIRELRKERGMTLAEVSKKSGVALATLSRIETGNMTGTFRSHMKIAKTFGMALPEFYSEMDKLVSMQRKADYADLFIPDRKVSSVILTKDISDKKMLPTLIQLKPDTKTQAERFKKGAEKFIYVLQGKIEITIDETNNILEEGATLYFDASHKHYIRNIGDTQTEYLCVMTPAIL